MYFVHGEKFTRFACCLVVVVVELSPAIKSLAAEDEVSSGV